MSHRCPGPGCMQAVSRSKLACPTHWFQVPKTLRDAVYAAYRGPGPGSPEHMDAIAAAIESMQEVPS
jgi:hypothetical protein